MMREPKEMAARRETQETGLRAGKAIGGSTEIYWQGWRLKWEFLNLCVPCANARYTLVE